MDVIKICVIVLLFAVWNGYVIAWKQGRTKQQQQKLSDKWLIVNISWTAYDVIINYLMGAPLLHVDGGRFTQFFVKKIGKKGFWMLKFSLILLNIIVIWL
jgi:hypothetical protein